VQIITDRDPEGLLVLRHSTAHVMAEAIQRLWPQAQLAYSAVDFDDFTDPFGAVVSLRDGDRLIGRIGLSVDYEDQWTDDTGQVSRAHVYGIANLYHDFLDGSEVDVSGTRFVSENRSLWGGLGVGASLSWADGRYAVFGEASARSSLKDFGDSYAVGAKVGLNELLRGID
jgi:fibronectin-binding autotransporter adhesin